MTIRPLQLSDLDQLTELEHAAARKPWSPSALASMLADQRATGWILPPAGYLFGHQVLDEAEIHSVGVHPAHRRQGVGRRLVEHALHTWRERDAAVVHLEVRDDNTAAIALYTAVGFRNTGTRRGYYGDCDALLMAVTL